MKRITQSAIRAAVKILQRAAKTHFGEKEKSESGENCIYIGPDKIDMTNQYGTIVARGPVKVATVLVRKRRKK